MAKGASNETIAQAIAEASIERDKIVAARYGVKPGTITAWRRRATEDPELRALADEARRALVGSWREEQSLTYVALLRRMRELVDAGEPIPIEVTGPVRILGASLIEAASLLDLDEPKPVPGNAPSLDEARKKREAG